MNRDDKITLGALAAGSVLLPLLLGLSLGWPLWAIVLLMLPLLAGSYVVTRRVAASRTVQKPHFHQFPPPVPEPARVEEPVAWQSVLADVPVPSAEPDYNFTFGAAVRWTVAHGHGGTLPGDPAATARKLVLQRACAHTASQSPANPQLTQHEIAAELGVRRLEPSCGLTCWAENVSLTLGPDDAERLHRLAALRKEQQVWEHERGFEINKRQYLGDDVLKSTGSAVVWQLAQDHRKVVETVELIDTMARLAAAANNEEAPEVFSAVMAGLGRREPVRADGEQAFVLSVPAQTPPPSPSPEADLAEEVFGAAESNQRVLFGEQLATLVETYGRPDVATRIRREFNTIPPDSAPEPPEHSE